MLARSDLARLAANLHTTSTHNLSRSTHLVQRRLISRNALSPRSSPACSRVYRAALVASYRSYATARSTPKVKRDVKKAVAKKPAAKKATKSKAAPKKKKAAKKPAAKKPAAKKPAKKPAKKLTPVQKEKAKEIAQKKKDKLLMDLYKARALDAPIPAKRHAWNVLAAESLLSRQGEVKAAQVLREAAVKLKNLTPAEKEASALLTICMRDEANCDFAALQPHCQRVQCCQRRRTGGLGPIPHARANQARQHCPRVFAAHVEHYLGTPQILQVEGRSSLETPHEPLCALLKGT